MWNDGISFVGVIAFIFRGLIIPLILSIYRKVDGGNPTLCLLVSFHIVMVLPR